MGYYVGKLRDLNRVKNKTENGKLEQLFLVKERMFYVNVTVDNYARKDKNVVNISHDDIEYIYYIHKSLKGNLSIKKLKPDDFLEKISE